MRLKELEELVGWARSNNHNSDRHVLMAGDPEGNIFYEIGRITEAWLNADDGDGESVNPDLVILWPGAPAAERP